MAAEPQVPFDVRAIAAYTARNNTEVSLEVGKVYHVQVTDGKGLWWQTKSDITGTVGWFPASYTEVIPSQAAAPVQPVYSAPAQQYQAPVQTQAQVQPAAAVVTQSVSSVSSNVGEVPTPAKPLQKEKSKQDSPVFVKIQVIEARGLRGEASKTSPSAFVIRHFVTDREMRNAQVLFAAPQVKKAITPRWNELYQVNVWDAETEIICVHIVNGKKNEIKGSKILGDVSFPLRSAARDFDHPKGKLKWYPLQPGKSGEKCTGECLIYIEFFDTREQHGPKDFKHESHVGWTKDGGFDINNIPAEWKKIFKQVGIRRADLENNPELANQVIDIMNNAAAESAGAPPAPTPQTYQAPAAPQPPMAPQPVYQAPVVAQPPPPPPPPVAGGPKPAPPPPAPGYSSHTPAAAAPPPPPPPAAASYQESSSNESSGGGMSELQMQLAAKAGKLRTVAPVENKPPPPAESGNSLSNALMSALKQHRKDIEGDDNDSGWGKEDNDDWD